MSETQLPRPDPTDERELLRAMESDARRQDRARSPETESAEGSGVGDALETGFDLLGALLELLGD